MLMLRRTSVDAIQPFNGKYHATHPAVVNCIAAAPVAPSCRPVLSDEALNPGEGGDGGNWDARTRNRVTASG
jgi:hypothetical protein